MTRGKHSKVTRRTRLRVTLAVALAAVAGGLVAFGVHAHRGGADAPTAAAGPSTAAIADEAGKAPPPPPFTTDPEAVSSSRASPVSLTIPAINVATNVIKLGLHKDGTVEVPQNPNDAGWYGNGPVPGQKGSSVILGHVDSKTGPAVFYRLRTLSAGDEIAVTLSDRMVAHYKVARVALYANNDFPAEKVYAGSPARPALNLVTCGGQYNRANGGYQSNVVVYTTYVRTTKR